MSSLVKMDYSRFKTYDKICQLQYKYSIELDRPVTKKNERQRYNMIYGNVMQDTFAFLYSAYLYKGRMISKEKLGILAEQRWPEKWREIRGVRDEMDRVALEMTVLNAMRRKIEAVKIFQLDLSDRKILTTVVETMIEFATKKLDEYADGIVLGVKYKPKKKEDFMREIRIGIRETLKRILGDSLFGAYEKAEIKIRRKKDGINMSGILDFLIIRGKRSGFEEQDLNLQHKEEYLILDGKSRRGNDDLDQLMFYALLVKFKFGFVPIRIGNLFYSDGSIQTTVPKEEDFKELWSRILRARDSILAREFNATVSRGCFWCPWSDQCDAYNESKYGVTKARETEYLNSDDSLDFEPEEI